MLTWRRLLSGPYNWASSDNGLARADKFRGVIMSLLFKGLVVLEWGLVKRVVNSGENMGGREDSFPGMISSGEGPFE